MICDICGDPIDIAARSTHVLVQGWLPRNMAGGGQVRNRRQVPRHFAHEVCVRRQGQGVPAEQGRLA